MAVGFFDQRRVLRASGTDALAARRCGQADALDEPRSHVRSWPPLRLARLRGGRGSVGVVSPAAPVLVADRAGRMRRVIGIDVLRTFAEVVIWKNGVTRRAGRVDMTRTALEGLGKKLEPTDDVVIEATDNCMAVSRVRAPFVAGVVIANPLQVRAIAHLHVTTDKVEAARLAKLHAAGDLPEVWAPDAATERLRRLVARRQESVRHRTRLKNAVHSILAAHLAPKCPPADLFDRRGRARLASQPLPDASSRLALWGAPLLPAAGWSSTYCNHMIGGVAAIIRQECRRIARRSAWR